MAEDQAQADSSLEGGDIIVQGSRPDQWGYYVDVSDRAGGEIDRRWVNDTDESIRLRDEGFIVDTNIAAGANLTLRTGNNADVVMPRVEADTATRVNVSTGGGNDHIAPTTLFADMPFVADAPRPEINVNGGEGVDTVHLNAPADRTVIQRTGENSYAITDGTGTTINVSDVEYLKGREADRPESLGPARYERTGDFSYRVTTGDGRQEDYDLSAIANGAPVPTLPETRERRGPSLPGDDRGVDLAGLNLAVGEGMTLQEAQRPITDPSFPLAEALAQAARNGQWQGGPDGYSPIRLESRPTDRAELGDVGVQNLRTAIERTRGQDEPSAGR